MGRAFSTSYLVGDPAACAFLSRDFRRPADRLAAVRGASGRKPDPALVAVLCEQQASLPPSAAREQNLEALVSGRAVAVVTGQQVGLFLGPLYTFYKALTAIAVARALQAESGVRCVPLFWLQTEDHDFPEIASCTTAGADGAPVRLALDGGPAEMERVSVAHRTLGPEVTRLLDDLAALTEGEPAAGQVLALLGRHYRPGRPVARAFAGALAEVCEDSGAGLLFLDPRDARVAGLAAPIYRRALDDASVIDRLLEDQVGRLDAAGFQAQIVVRAGSPLVFFHPQGASGPRFRLQAENGAQGEWRLAGAAARVSRGALLEALAAEPLRFSTSALLRPIVQDSLLPTAAYVGGPAEVSYFAQLQPLYAHFAVSPPLLVPRARCRCVDARARRRLAALGLGPEDLARPLPELLARLAMAPAGKADPGELRRRAAAEVEPIVAQIADAVAAAEPSLARAAERTRASAGRALARLTDRYARRLAERDGVTRRRLEQLRDALYPGGVAQERVFGWIWLAARVGPAALGRMVRDALSAGNGPFDPTIRELRP
ncbi:MAG TPA: bacillithiol biosynthesis cysteine-adding enzyme BshC [Polyangia bacterium]|nr:bacillithiol biosynthesis cysteine-adding enzyme BshC [Polyangia bacterium]